MSFVSVVGCFPCCHDVVLLLYLLTEALAMYAEYIHAFCSFMIAVNISLMDVCAFCFDDCGL